MERILCAAIHWDDGIKDHPHQPINIKSGYVVSGMRHHNCFATHSILTGKLARKHPEVQGFITDKNRFVHRREAASLAWVAGQTDELLEVLYSEDLY